MKRPWMPLYIKDYLFEARHLSLEESGAYLHLIMEYWDRGGLPTDDASLAGLLRIKPRDWAKIKVKVQPFFQKGWKHKRIDAELAKAAGISEKRAEAAKLRHRDESNAPANDPAIADANADANAPANQYANRRANKGDENEQTDQQLDTHARNARSGVSDRLVPYEDPSRREESLRKGDPGEAEPEPLRVIPGRKVAGR